MLGLSCGVWDLSSLIRDWIWNPCIGEHRFLATGPSGKSLEWNSNAMRRGGRGRSRVRALWSSVKQKTDSVRALCSGCWWQCQPGWRKYGLSHFVIRLIIFFAAKDGETLYNQQKQDQELTVAQIMNTYCQFRLKLKKVGKTSRPFRYDLNQIPYHYTVEVRNRFKGLDLIDRLPEELWIEVHDII